MKSLLTKYGAFKLSDVAQEHYEAFMRDAEELGQSKHALLSPSSSHRWMNCTPSAMQETEFKNKSSSAAEEGTVAHTFCEHKLKKLFA